MAASSTPHRWKYDVFVSFRGEDIRKSFIDHLFNDFKQKGIYAFRDDNELPKGEEISPHLYKAIEESRFLIVIFSKDYASSSWCLRELVKILECKQIKTPKHEVQIIFYDVKPDVVRKQTGSYAEAFAKHELSSSTEMDKWKDALSMAANLSGWDLQDMTNGYESKFIDCISKEILKKLCDGHLHVGDYLVGIDFHFDKLELSRFVGSDKVNMIGICGISGIGKTTLAKAIYNLMHIQFEGSCFCDDVQGVEKRQGLTQVQMQMIGKILKREDLQISSVGEGTMIIKKRMACKRILLVLDDVNNLEQLEALAGSSDWFFPGSLIIFTGKDKQLLRSHNVEIYEMETLEDREALKLFSLYAFGKRHPTKDFNVLTSQVIIHLQGHPLALKIFGRLLHEKSVDVWKSELDRLQTYPNSDILQKLRPSFDGLASDQKRMFLDIACAFIGENRYFAASVLDSSNCSANANIEVLVDKFLITVSPCNMSLQMHELIQSMAREIIREEFNMPGNRSRLWISSEFYDALNKNKVTEEVEVLILLLKNNGQNIPIDGKDFTRMKNLRILKFYSQEHWQPFAVKLSGKDFTRMKNLRILKFYSQEHRQPFAVKLSGKDFTRMKNLRILKFYSQEHWQPFAVKLSGSLEFLSNELRLFCWHGCPFKYLPSDFYPENIVAVDLSYSQIKQLWTTPKSFRRLKAMKLRYCCNLTTTPDFSEIINLEELSLEGCVNLVSVHPSIGMLKRLVVLNLRDCKRLQNFPSRVEMDALQVLNLTGCLKVDQLPEVLGRIKTLVELHIDRTAITKLPSFVFSLINLESLSFGRNGKIKSRWLTSITAPFGLPSKQQHPQRSVLSSVTGLHMLKYLNFSYCNLLEVPESIGGLSCLETLYLQGNNFSSLPRSFSQLSSLGWISVDGCKKLEVLPELPPRVWRISARDCNSLREVSGSSKDQLRYSYNDFSNCPNLFKNVTIDSEGSISKTQCLDSSITSQGSIQRLSFLGNLGFPTNRCEFFLQDIDSNLDIVYHGNSIPEWFTNRSTGNRVKVELPSDSYFNKLRGFGTCLVFKRKKPCRYIDHSVENFGGNFVISSYYEFPELKMDDSCIIWLRYTSDIWELSNLWKWEEAKNFVTFWFGNEDIEVKECGARLICDGDLHQDVTNLSMFQDLLPLSSQHGGAICYDRYFGGNSIWSW